MKIDMENIGSNIKLITSLARNTTKDKILDSLCYYISSTEINGEKCYYMKPLFGITNVFYMISKNNGTLIRNGWVQGEGTDLWKIITDFKYSFDTVTDEEVSKPDLTGYEIITNNS